MARTSSSRSWWNSLISALVIHTTGCRRSANTCAQNMKSSIRSWLCIGWYFSQNWRITSSGTYTGGTFVRMISKDRLFWYSGSQPLTYTLYSLLGFVFISPLMINGLRKFDSPKPTSNAYEILRFICRYGKKRLLLAIAT